MGYLNIFNVVCEDDVVGFLNIEVLMLVLVDMSDYC